MIGFLSLLLLGSLSLLFTLLIWRDHAFDRMIAWDLEDLLQAREESHQPPKRDSAEHDGLPEPVRRYIRFAFSGGQKDPTWAQIKYTGQFRTNNPQWGPLEAEGVLIREPPGFLWQTKMNVLLLLWIRGRDKYLRGRGYMLIKLLSTMTITDMTGEEMDQSGLMRWLCEAPFFPPALQPSPHLMWEEIDDRTARAIVEDEKVRGSAVFHFDDVGRITQVHTDDRYRDVEGIPFKVPWMGLYRNYREVAGFMIPMEGEAVWNLPQGDFSYLRFVVEEAVYS